MPAVRFEIEGSLGHLVLADPPFNWIGDAYRVELRTAIHDANESDVRALLVRGEGPNFSMGGAVHEWTAHSPLWLRTFLAEIVQSYRALEALRIPVVAAVRGTAAGGGLELALACDFIIASDNAVVWSPEILGAMIPLGGAVQRLARRIGPTGARRIVMLGEKTSITDVPDLADHVVADDVLDQFALDFATRLAQGPTRAYSAAEALLKAYSAGGVALADQLLDDLSAHLFATQDVGTGMSGFVPAYAQVAAAGAPLAGGIELPHQIFAGL